MARPVIDVEKFATALLAMTRQMAEEEESDDKAA
jgi:hypothetical protein